MELTKLVVGLLIALATNATSITMLVKEVHKIYTDRKNKKQE